MLFNIKLKYKGGNIMSTNLMKTNTQEFEQELALLIIEFKIWWDKKMITIVDEYAFKIYSLLSDNRDKISENEFKEAELFLDAIIQYIWRNPDANEAIEELRELLKNKNKSDSDSKKILQLPNLMSDLNIF